MKRFPPPEPLPGEGYPGDGPDAKGLPACGADYIGPVSGDCLLDWVREKATARTRNGKGEVASQTPGKFMFKPGKTRRVLPRVFIGAPVADDDIQAQLSAAAQLSGGPLACSPVPGHPRLVYVSRVDLVTLFDRGADVDLMAFYEKRQRIAKRGRKARADGKVKPWFPGGYKRRK